MAKNTAALALFSGMALTTLAALIVPGHVLPVADAKPAVPAPADPSNERQLAALSKQVQQLSQQLNLVARAQSKTAPSGEQAREVQRLSPEELSSMREQQAAEDKASVAELDHAVDSESRDEAWAAEYEAGAQRSLTARFPTLSISEIKCARTVCRLSVHHASVKDQSDFVDAFWTALPGFASAAYELIPDAHGSPGTMVHILRKSDAAPPSAPR